MSILIKGAMPPSGCAFCYFNVDSKCALIPGCNYDETNGWQRRDDCPLIELPDHGDLIEKDPLLKKAEELEEQARSEFERYKWGETNWEQTERAKWRIAYLERIGFKHGIADMPVVIPAERSEE